MLVLSMFAYSALMLHLSTSAARSGVDYVALYWLGIVLIDAFLVGLVGYMVIRTLSVVSAAYQRYRRPSGLPWLP
jgi:hypothetical protein